MRLIIFLFCLLSLELSGQSINIRGTILNKDKEAVEYSNIHIYKLDSTFVAGTTSKDDGTFLVQNINTDSYFIKVSSIGYETTYISLCQLEESVDIGNVFLLNNTVELDEVEVTASNVITTSDKYIGYLTRKQQKISTNGIDALQYMMLPRLSVDPISGKITIAGGESVQLRINGATATIEEIKAISPNDILRIEYLDNPGLRYGNVAAVVDYITKRHQKGGSIFGNLQNSFLCNYGNEQLGGKLNYKNSEFNLIGLLNYRNYHGLYRDNNEIFDYNDGSVVTRSERGMPGDLRFNESWIMGSYNYLVKDKHFFNASVSLWLFNEPKREYNSSMWLNANNKIDSLQMRDLTSNHQKLPNLDLYYQYSLDKRQLLLFNIVSTFSDAKNTRLYEEYSIDNTLSYYSSAKSNRYSVIGEMIYENKLNIGTLSTGIKHLQSYSKNKYFGDNPDISEMREAASSIYAEFNGKYKKFNYTVGLRGAFNYFDQKGVDYQKLFTVLPTMRLSYRINDLSSLKYSFRASRETPSLAQLSDITQIIDSFQVIRGNPNLKPFTLYSSNLSYDFRVRNLGVTLYTLYAYSHKPAMDITLFENRTFIRTYENFKKAHRINVELSLALKLFQDFMQISINGGANHFRSIGYNKLQYNYTDWYYNANIAMIYKKFILNTNVNKQKNIFSGSEVIRSGERGHSVQLKYNESRYSISVGAKNPFSNDYKMSYRNISSLAPYQANNYINDLSRMYYVTFTWNLNFGRSFDNIWKKTYNSDSNESIVKGSR